MASAPERLYDDDFYAWTREQAAELKKLADARWNGPLDLRHLALEVEGLGNEQRWAVESHLERILEHVLKLEHSPAAGPRRQWMISVNTARSEIRRRLTRAIRNEVEAGLAERYRDARRNAEFALLDHGEVDAAQALPGTCPYRFDDLIDPDWWPTSRHGSQDDA